MPLGVVKKLSEWKFQDSHVERNMDASAMRAAHPDDTLVLAGSPRVREANTGITANAADTTVPLLPIGMLQQISFQQGKPTQPLMAIGGGRAFFTSGKAQTSWSAARLYVNGRNFLRVLYHSAVAAGMDVTKFDDRAAAADKGPTANTDAAQPKYFVNLDSELFYMPFGMACIFRNKNHDICGSFYAEMCMINSWGTAINAGQSQIMESVSGVADRLLPYKFTVAQKAEAATDSTPATDAVGEGEGAYSATLKTLLGFTNNDF